MRVLGLLMLIFLTISCSRGYYNVSQTYYDFEESYELVEALKEGMLIIQIPCTKKKTEILYSMYLKEEDPDKKSKLKEEYEQETLQLAFTQESIFKATMKYYDFSDYAFVPDTLIRAFKNGRRDNIFLKPDLTLGEEIKIDETKEIFYLRYVRDFDDLRIYRKDGSVPPDPFPYASTVPTGDMDLFDLEETSEMHLNIKIFHAINIVNKRLKGFLEKNKSPNSK